MIDQQQIFVSASIGMTVADGASNSTEMLRRADLSMYDAKASGRGTWRPFKPEMDAQRRERHALESELRHALHRGELDLHFQPIVNLAEGRTSGFEALLRWHRGGGGVVPPDKFIPLAEETGLIVPIGDWVLRRACEEATTWPADVRVAVNVSAKQFRQQHILRSLITALAATGLAPERLELELTETVLLHGNDDNLKVLNECRRLGVRLSMDDFGTGYSSLAYFRLFQFDNVKIDRSFVAGYRNEREGGAVIRAVVGLASAFEFATIAEGVETEDQLTYLRSIGCHEAQGFLLGRPRPAAQVNDSMRRPTLPTLTPLGTPA